MNAATQRRLTPWLAGAVVVLGIGLLALLSGVGRGVRWDAPHHAAPLPAAHPVALPPPPPLDGYATVWQHPLFNSDRKPLADDTAGGAHVSLGDLELTGIILTPGLRMALLRDKSAGDKDGAVEVRVRQGDALPDGSWKLVGLKPRSAVFASASGRTVLKLPAGAPIDAPPAASPVGQRPASASPGQRPPASGAADVHRVVAPARTHGLRTGQPPIPPPPQGAQLQRMLKLKAAILKQRARQHRADDGDH
jgi:general secretion pathway protein N